MRLVLLVALAACRTQPTPVGVTPAPRPLGDSTASACDAGDLVACYNLGVRYSKGKGVTQDKARAIALYEKACAGGVIDACINGAAVYEHGYGIPRNDARAAQLNAKACDAHDLEGCANLASLTANGRGVPQDVARAVELFERACTGGFAKACSNHGVIVSRGLAPGGHVRAVELYTQACDRGYLPGCLNLAINVDEGRGTAKDPAQAARLFTLACKGGEGTACYHLGRFDEALRLLEPRCITRRDEACGTLGLMYRDGRGVPQDEARARELLREGCDGGDHRSCGAL